VSENPIVGEVVYRHDIDVCSLSHGGSKVVAADATKPINSNINCQLRLQYFVMSRSRRLKGCANGRC
jgi:hypothetical protein